MLARKLPNARGAHILLALSGGGDSTALAYILTLLTPLYSLRLSALHLDHCLRPESAQDAAFTQKLCDGLGIPLTVERMDVAQAANVSGWGLEEAGRNMRLHALAQRRVEIGAHFIATGHQLDDLGEDVLMRLIRGAGWPALGGMKFQTGHIIRPLLHVPSAKLKDFLTAIGASWREDASNANLQFRRNRMRHLVLPLLNKENPRIGESFANLHKLAELDADYWEQTLNDALARHPWDRRDRELYLSAELLGSLHPAARLRLYMKGCQYLASALGIPAVYARAEILHKVNDAIHNNSGEKYFQAGGGVVFHVARGAVIVRVKAGRM